MNKKDRSLEEVDILKILIYSFTFVVICVVLILFLIVPFLKDYKINYSRLAKQEIQNTKAINELKNLEETIENFKKTNKIRLMQINSDFSQDDFVKFMQNYFDDIKIKSIPIKQDKIYLKYQFNVQVKIKSPQAFYSFLNDLQKYQNLVEINTPVSFSANQKYINLNFKVNVFFAKAIEK
ncbi:hypothetical protein [Campylobacter insulaenigrae]|uniref:hypothetical protein n=1 Tax=Campylobacter insulaenigrae TaxID=260714 RepID=UPI00215248F5|nr:hypothetical protein [Campylobacter insulaenigrae]MCR6594007.1 hypothetical protein [Campylobacter insulaenigrae]